MRFPIAAVVFGSVMTGLAATPASAQSDDFAMLMGLGDNELVSELTMRYDAGLAASLDQSIIGADDPRYLWALETKVQCGIALGYMKSDTRDETSIRNCAHAYLMMQRVPAPPPVVVAPPPPQPKPAICSEDIVGIAFFEFDSAEVSSDAGTMLNTVAQHVSICGWRRLDVVGHTDQAGSNQYNMGLSEARADAIAAALRSRNVGGVQIDVSAQGESNPRVPLPDGTRSPQNRRVEISAE